MKKKFLLMFSTLAILILTSGISYASPPDANVKFKESQVAPITPVQDICISEDAVLPVAVEKVVFVEFFHPVATTTKNVAATKPNMLGGADPCDIVGLNAINTASPEKIYMANYSIANLNETK